MRIEAAPRLSLELMRHALLGRGIGVERRRFREARPPAGVVVFARHRQVGFDCGRFAGGDVAFAAVATVPEQRLELGQHGNNLLLVVACLSEALRHYE